MKHEKLSEAMNEITDAHIAEAATPKKRRYAPWISAVAAVLALAILTGALWHAFPAADTSPTGIVPDGRFLVAAPFYPEMAQYSEANWGAWWESQKQQYDQPENYAAGTEDFFRSSIQTLLTSETESQAYSPINVYMALAMLAETTGGDSRQQLLDLLGADSVEALRAQAGYMWNAHYCDDGMSTSILASSLWLDSAFYYNYDMDTVNTLADSYYASVFQGDLGSEAVNEALQDWLNEQTDGLLKEQAQGIELDDDALLALATTIYYNVQWAEDFNEANNFDGVFHAPGGDVDATYMYQILHYGPYYRGEDFSAVYKSLRDGSKMWLILPDEGCTPADILESGHVLDMVLQDISDGQDVQVNLSVPKFDIVSDMDLIPALKALGVTDVFDPSTADLTNLITTADDYPYVSEIQHATRVAIDEKGVLAAAYTVIEVDGAAAEIDSPPIDFILDRPFLFIIESRDNIPIFAGIVNEP